MSRRRERRFLALRTGVAAGAAVIPNTFARGLLPRSAGDQAMVSVATAAYGMGVGTVAVSAVEATSELIVGARGSGDPEITTLVTAAALAAAGVTASKLLPNTHDAPFPVAAASSTAWALWIGSLMSSLVIATDRVTRPLTRGRGPVLGVATSAAVGGAVAAVRVRSMERRARQVGGGANVPPRPPEKPTEGMLTSLGLGGAVGGGLLALAGVEFAIAEGSATLISAAFGRRDDPIPPVVGHAIAATTLAPVGVYALNRLRRRMQHADDVVEPAYPKPPTSPFVTAGPRSVVSFDDIGKEGRRFVLMTLTAEQIGALMGEPALDPIRAVAGFESADTPQERAALALRELETLGAYDRSVIVVAAPTGVGYVNYSFAEALEYLTRGDCAIVVPQYAMVPSALALNATPAGVELQRLLLAGIRNRIARLPDGRRPRLLQFGESLGAQVALDVAAGGTRAFDDLGVEAGLYLGTPFRTKLWDEWFHDSVRVDPAGILGMVDRADRIPELPARVRHVQVIHDDDPINKFSYDAVVRAPWWMGPPDTRPAGVPRETVFRPVVTFILNLVDLKNGMDSKPGTFVRVGHDYRIELCDAIRYTFGLHATPEQAARIEVALREREREWAARRMVAKRFSSARTAVVTQLTKWGVDPSGLGLDDESAEALARGDLASLSLRSPGTST